MATAAMVGSSKYPGQRRAPVDSDRGLVRVVIGEDLFLLRDGLVRLLEAHGFEVVAAVGSAPELLRR